MLGSRHQQLYKGRELAVKKNIVLKYRHGLLTSLRDKSLVIRVDSLDKIRDIYTEFSRRNQVLAIVADLPFTAISQIEFREEWINIPTVINAYNIGNYDLLLRKIGIIRNLNVRIMLSGSSDNVYTDLKLLASLGIDCGLLIDDGIKLSDEKFLDLASYAYISPFPHASIQPFEYILRHLGDDNKSSFSAVYFDDCLTFCNYDKQSCQDAIDEAETNEFAFDVNIKMKDYYSHFLKLDTCSKCPAFRVCNRGMASVLSDCKKTMSEIYEYAELRERLNNNQGNTKSVCQL